MSGSVLYLANAKDRVKCEAQLVVKPEVGSSFNTFVDFCFWLVFSGELRSQNKNIGRNRKLDPFREWLETFLTELRKTEMHSHRCRPLLLQRTFKIPRIWDAFWTLPAVCRNRASSKTFQEILLNWFKKSVLRNSSTTTILILSRQSECLSSYQHFYSTSPSQGSVGYLVEFLLPVNCCSFEFLVVVARSFWRQRNFRLKPNLRIFLWKKWTIILSLNVLRSKNYNSSTCGYFVSPPFKTK